METTRRSAVMRWFSLTALVAACALVFSGCAAGGGQAQQQHVAEPATIISVLPSRPGLSPATPVKGLNAAQYTTALLGHPDADLTRTLERGGFQRGASRTWTGADGAELTALAALWGDGDPAQVIGGDAADALVEGGSVWMPTEFPGSQGRRSTDARALNVVIGKVSLFLRASGPVDDAAVLRQMYLMYQPAAGRDRRGTGADG